MGLQERGGRLQAEVIPNVRKPTLRNVVTRNVEPGTIVSTDELMSYGLLERDAYKHGTMNHDASTTVAISFWVGARRPKR
jgi:transposase